MGGRVGGGGRVVGFGGGGGGGGQDGCERRIEVFVKNKFNFFFEGGIRADVNGEVKF